MSINKFERNAPAKAMQLKKNAISIDITDHKSKYANNPVRKDLAMFDFNFKSEISPI